MLPLNLGIITMGSWAFPGTVQHCCKNARCSSNLQHPLRSAALAPPLRPGGRNLCRSRPGRGGTTEESVSTPFRPRPESWCFVLGQTSHADIGACASFRRAMSVECPDGKRRFIPVICAMPGTHCKLTMFSAIVEPALFQPGQSQRVCCGTEEALIGLRPFLLSFYLGETSCVIIQASASPSRPASP